MNTSGHEAPEPEIPGREEPSKAALELSQGNLTPDQRAANESLLELQATMAARNGRPVRGAAEAAKSASKEQAAGQTAIAAAPVEIRYIDAGS